MQDLTAIAQTLAALQTQIAALQGISDSQEAMGFLDEIPNVSKVKYVSLAMEAGTCWHYREDKKSIPINAPCLRGRVTSITARKFDATDDWGEAWKLNVFVETDTETVCLQASLKAQSGKSMLKSLAMADLSQPVVFVPEAGDKKTVFVNLIDHNGRVFTKDVHEELAAALLEDKGFLTGEHPWSDDVAAPQPPTQTPFQGVQQPVQNLPPAPEGFNGQGWLLFQKDHLEAQFGVKINPASIKGMIENTYGPGTKSESLTWEQANVIYQSMAALAQNMAQQAIPNPETIANAPQAPRPQPTSHDGRSID